MKKFLAGFALLFFGIIAYSQGLEGLIVEKYYEANAADQAEFGMPEGTVIYRFYIDMLPGWELNDVKGNANHELFIETYTSAGRFWNSSFAASVYKGEGIAFNPALAGVPGYYGLFLDSWITFGAATSEKLGVLKPEDTDGSILTGQFNTPALDVEDGLITGTLSAITVIGIDASAISQFSASGLSTGNRFATSTGAWNILGGIQGPDPAENKVLIAQVATTDGDLIYEFMVTLNDPYGALVPFVASNPQTGENLFPGLAGTTFVPNQAPTAAITAPAPGTVYTTGDVVNITATGNDPDGSVVSMHFWVNGTIDLGVDNTPGDGFSRNWTTSASGTYQLTAVATDNEGLEGLPSPQVEIQVNDPNTSPTVSITSPTAGSSIEVGTVVTIEADASDPDPGDEVESVEFRVNGSPVGTDYNGADGWSADWIAVLGPATLTAVASDGVASTTSAPVNISVFDPQGSPYTLGSSLDPCYSPDIFCVPVERTRDDHATEGVIGFDAIMKFNAAKVAPTGRLYVYDGMGINPDSAGYAMNVQADSIFISVFLTGLEDNIYWTGTGNVFCVEFARLPAFGDADQVVFSMPLIVESYDRSVSVNLGPVYEGTFETYVNYLFPGMLKFWKDFSPIRGGAGYAVTDITNCPWDQPSIHPDGNGYFEYDISIFGLDLQVDRDIPSSADVMPVINGMDAQLTARVTINDATFTPSIYQILAMDVNMDGKVSAGDISQINQRTVFMIDEFKQAWNYSGGTITKDAKDWLFIDNTSLRTNTDYRISANYPLDDGEGYSKQRVPNELWRFCTDLDVRNPDGTPYDPMVDGCPLFNSETWVGILLGDVNGNWADVPADGSLKSASAEVVLFDMVNARSQGNILDVPVSVSSENVVYALDFALKYNKNKMSFKSVIEFTDKLEALSYYKPEDQTLRFTSYSLSKYPVNRTILALRFEMISQSITHEDLNEVQAYINGDAATAHVSEVTAATGINKLNNPVVIVYPNPASDKLFVEVSGEVNIQILDINGKVIVMKAQLNAVDKHEIDVSDLASGVYFMRIYNNEFSSFQKVVIQK